MNPIHVLIKLYPGYGLGDAVQMTAVLRHVRKHLPNWIVDYVADKGKHSAAIGLVRNAVSYEDALPAKEYDREVEIKLYDTFAAWKDRPNTRVTSCLHERFGLGWDPECGRYQINIQPDALNAAKDFLASTVARNRIVAVQYQGDSSRELKNLSHVEAAQICTWILNLGRTPLLMDWRNISPIPDGREICTTGRLSMSDTWGRDAQMNTAIISQCEAYVGIDSGPGKCATATETPTLIVWTGHHPALFHDPAPNTTHLVPAGHRDNPILRGNMHVAEWFEAHYHWRTYDECCPIGEVKNWLKEVLR